MKGVCKVESVSGNTLCGKKVYEVYATQNWDKVTCKDCLRGRKR